jgi:hypothetical protein
VLLLTLITLGGPVDGVREYIGADPTTFLLATLSLALLILFMYARGGGAEESQIRQLAVVPVLVFIIGCLLAVPYAWFYIPILVLLTCRLAYVNLGIEDLDNLRRNDVINFARLTRGCLALAPVSVSLAIYASIRDAGITIVLIFLSLAAASLFAAELLYRGAVDVDRFFGSATVESAKATAKNKKMQEDIESLAAKASLLEHEAKALKGTAEIRAQEAREAAAERDRYEARMEQMVNEAATKAGIQRQELEKMGTRIKEEQKQRTIDSGRHAFHGLADDARQNLLRAIRNELLKEGAVEGTRWMKVTHLSAQGSVNTALEALKSDWDAEGVNSVLGTIWEALQDMQRNHEIELLKNSSSSADWLEKVSLTTEGAKTSRQQEGALYMTNYGQQSFGTNYGQQNFGTQNIEQMIGSVSGNAFYNSGSPDLEKAVKRLLEVADDTRKTEEMVDQSTELVAALDDLPNAGDKKSLKQTVTSILAASALIGTSAKPILECAKTIHEMLA